MPVFNHRALYIPAVASVCLMWACMRSAGGTSASATTDSSIAIVVPDTVMLPPYHWDTTGVFKSVKEVQAEKKKKDSALQIYISTLAENPDKKFMQDSLMFAMQDEYAVAMYKVLEKAPKDQLHLNYLQFLPLVAPMMDKSRLQDLFNQYPQSVRQSQAGKKAAGIFARMHANEGQNISRLLAENRMTAMDGKVMPVSELLKGAPVNIIVFGASWCGPCKYDSKMLHRAAANWDPSRFRIVHLSIDKSREKWMASEEKLEYSREAYLLGGHWDNSLFKALNLRGVPACIVVDQDGKVLLDVTWSKMLLKRMGPQLGYAELAAVEPTDKLKKIAIRP